MVGGVGRGSYLGFEEIGYLSIYGGKVRYGHIWCDFFVFMDFATGVSVNVSRWRVKCKDQDSGSQKFEIPAVCLCVSAWMRICHKQSSAEGCARQPAGP